MTFDSPERNSVYDSQKLISSLELSLCEELTYFSCFRTWDKNERCLMIGRQPYRGFDFEDLAVIGKWPIT